MWIGELEGCKALDMYQLSGLSPIYDLWWMLPPLAVKSFLSLSVVYNAAEARLWLNQWLMCQEWNTSASLNLEQVVEMDK